jgi:uncharacterized membrane protein YqjE
MEGPQDKKPGIFASLKRLLKTVAAIAGNRLELLLVEWQEERWRFFEALLLAGIVFILALMTLMVATITIVVICVDNHRIDLVVVLGLVYLAATIGCSWRLRNRLKGWAPFAATLAEIKKDKACLDEKN